MAAANPSSLASDNIIARDQVLKILVSTRLYFNELESAHIIKKNIALSTPPLLATSRPLVSSVTLINEFRELGAAPWIHRPASDSVAGRHVRVRRVSRYAGHFLRPFAPFPPQCLRGHHHTGDNVWSSNSQTSSLVCQPAIANVSTSACRGFSQQEPGLAGKSVS